MANKAARFAARYCELGFALTWTAPGHKGPRHSGWNKPDNAITAPAAALKHWSRRPAHGIACLLAPSRLVSLDIDDETLSPGVLRHFGVDLDELRETAPCIVGRHYRIMFRAPDMPLKHVNVAWPNEDDSLKSAVLFELRAGLVADTLPPTIHPGTGQAYRWENPPRHGFPKLPQRILELWTDPKFDRRALALCPWAPTLAPPAPPAPPRPPAARRNGPSVIDTFNAAHDASAILEAHGYVRRGKRFASPETGHAAGITLLEDGKIFCHHGGDKLKSEHALDAFDLFRVLEHGGQFSSAVKAAAQALGIKR